MSGFVFSNKIVALSERVRLENDLGRRLDDRQSGSFLNLVVKDEASPNVFDTGIGWTSRGNAAVDGLEAARRSLRAYRNEVPMPKEKLPVLFAGSFLSGKLEGLLDVQKLESGASLFSGKMGEKLFSRRVDAARSTGVRRAGCRSLMRRAPCSRATHCRSSKTACLCAAQRIVHRLRAMAHGDCRGGRRL